MSYLVDYDFPTKWQKKIQDCLGVHFINRQALDGFLDGCGMKWPEFWRRASEAVLYGSLIGHGVPSDFSLHCGGAGQFDVFIPIPPSNLEQEARQSGDGSELFHILQMDLVIPVLFLVLGSWFFLPFSCPFWSLREYLINYWTSPKFDQP